MALAIRVPPGALTVTYTGSVPPAGVSSIVKLGVGVGVGVAIP